MALFPKELTEFMLCKPLICPSRRSSGVVTVETMTSGLAPGYCAVIWIVGKSTDGSAEIGSSE